MIMDFGQNPRRDNQTMQRQAYAPAHTMEQLHNTYRARIADLERELVAARQYIARLQAELRTQGEVRPAPPTTPIPARWDPTPGPSAEARAFYGDHLGCSHPYDIGGDEMEE